MNDYVLNQKIRRLESLWSQVLAFSDEQKESRYFGAIAITALLMGDYLNTHSALYNNDEYLEWIESYYHDFYDFLKVNNFQSLQDELDTQYVWVKFESADD